MPHVNTPAKSRIPIGQLAGRFAGLIPVCGFGCFASSAASKARVIDDHDHTATQNLYQAPIDLEVEVVNGVGLQQRSEQPIQQLAFYHESPHRSRQACLSGLSEIVPCVGEYGHIQIVGADPIRNSISRNRPSSDIGHQFKRES